jgi:hypothetical protein
LLLSKLVQHLDLGLKPENFQITLLDALSMLKVAWDKVSQDTIVSSFCMAGFGRECDITTSVPILSWGASQDVCQHAVLEPLLGRLYDTGQVMGQVTAADYVAVDDDLATSVMASSEPLPPLFPLSPGGESVKDDCGEREPSISQLDALAAMSKVGLHLMQLGCDDMVISLFQEFKKAYVNHMVLASKKMKQEPV